MAPGSAVKRAPSQGLTPGADPYVVHLRSDTTKLLISHLSVLHHNKDMLAQLEFSKDGLLVSVEDCKAFVSTVRFTPAHFHAYSWNPAAIHDNAGTPGREQYARFQLNLTILIECLSVFGTGSALRLTYQGASYPLHLFLEDDSVVTECSIRTVDPEEGLNLMFLPNPPVSVVGIRASALKDAFSELDWSDQHVEISLSPAFPGFALSTDTGASSCKVSIPSTSPVFTRFSVEARITWQYRLALLQPVLRALSIAREAEVSINGDGVLKMSLLINQDHGAENSFIDYILLPLEPTTEEFV